MPIETATSISQLNASNPPPSDLVSQADDHLRLIKAVLLANFPHFNTTPLAASNAALDAAVNAIVNGTAAAVLALGSAAAPTLGFTGDSNTGVFSPGADQVSISTGGTVAMAAAADHSVNFPVNAKVKNTQIASVPIGGGIEWYCDALPTEDGATWAWCNGQAVSRATYASLFTRIGTVYGAGDGSTTFNLPDRREFVGVGKATMGGTVSAGRLTGSGYTANSLASQIGESVHTLAISEIPAHAHPGTTAASSVSPNPHSHTIQTGGGAAASPLVTASNAGGLSASTDSTSLSVTTTVTMASQGGGAFHNNVQASIVVNYIMRVL